MAFHAQKANTPPACSSRKTEVTGRAAFQKYAEKVPETPSARTQIWRRDECQSTKNWWPVSSGGEQFAQPGDGVCRDAREHVAEPGKRFNAAPFAGSNEAPQHRRRFAAAVAAKECPVTAAQRDVAIGPFRSPVVNLQFAVFEKAR
jgi:hypothetical protein